jgi:hypothetical protein
MTPLFDRFRGERCVTCNNLTMCACSVLYIQSSLLTLITNQHIAWCIYIGVHYYSIACLINFILEDAENQKAWHLHHKVSI